MKNQEVYNASTGMTEEANLLGFTSDEFYYERGSRGARGGNRGARGGARGGRGARQQQQHQVNLTEDMPELPKDL